MTDPRAIRLTILQLLSEHQRQPNAPAIAENEISERLTLPLANVQRQLRILCRRGQVALSTLDDRQVAVATQDGARVMDAVA